MNLLIVPLLLINIFNPAIASMDSLKYEPKDNRNYDSTFEIEGYEDHIEQIKQEYPEEFNFKERKDSHPEIISLRVAGVIAILRCMNRQGDITKYQARKAIWETLKKKGVPNKYIYNHQIIEASNIIANQLVIKKIDCSNPATIQSDIRSLPQNLSRKISNLIKDTAKAKEWEFVGYKEHEEFFVKPLNPKSSKRFRVFDGKLFTSNGLIEKRRKADCQEWKIYDPYENKWKDVSRYETFPGGISYSNTKLLKKVCKIYAKQNPRKGLGLFD